MGWSLVVLGVLASLCLVAYVLSERLGRRARPKHAGEDASREAERLRGGMGGGMGSMGGWGPN